MPDLRIRLTQVVPNPMVTLNRAVAVAMMRGSGAMPTHERDANARARCQRTSAMPTHERDANARARCQRTGVRIPDDGLSAIGDARPTVATTREAGSVRLPAPRVRR
jgi:hypothetical protein